MKKKLFYEAPDSELIELKLDATVMQASPGVEGGAGGDDPIVDDDDDLS